jgi:putative FmdB family regulatory protein
MPIYEYTCEDCGFRFDTLRSMKDADLLIECSKCNSKKTRRMLSHCYSQSEGRSNASVVQNSTCGGCSGGSCASCRH